MKEIVLRLALVICLMVLVVVIFVVNDYNYNKTTHKEDVPVTEWISPDGVHYWYQAAGYHSMLAPRYDGNGELVIE